MPDRFEDIQKVDKMRCITEYINRAGFIAMNEALRKKVMKLSVRQCSVMANIRRYTLIHPEGIPMSLLAERTGMSPSAASHMIDNLMSAGMVERKQSATDRRAVLVTVATASQEASAAIESAQQQAIDDLLSTLEEEERATYIRVLDKLYARVVERDGM